MTGKIMSGLGVFMPSLISLIPYSTLVMATKVDVTNPAPVTQVTSLGVLVSDFTFPVKQRKW